MSTRQLDAALGGLLANGLAPETMDARWLAGILGDHPSTYSRSPALWNAAFERLGLDARYGAFDVAGPDLEPFIAALRASPGMLGVNVTVPYKQRVIPLIDRLDPVAQAIGAVNCIVRTKEGSLLGSNTDAEGALACLIRERPEGAPFFPQLAGITVLQVGAGGAGRAVAAALAPRLGDSGRLLLANRTVETARSLARSLDPGGGRITPLAESELIEKIRNADLVINASTRGQAGFFQVGPAGVTCLEPYSPLGPAAPAIVDPAAYGRETDRWSAWYFASVKDVRANERRASAVLERARPTARFFDLVYAPAEPVLLRTARWAGHATLNGSDMILHQAVAGFLLIAARLLDEPIADRRTEIESAMRSA